MISLPSAVRIFLCTRDVDLRKSFDGLSGLVHDCFGRDPLSGHLFLFLNRRRDRIKLLYFDRDGLAIWYKRLEVGTFQMPHSTQNGIELLDQFLHGLSAIASEDQLQHRNFATYSDLVK